MFADFEKPNLIKNKSIEFRELGKANKTRKASDFRELLGIWRDREVTLNNLRQKEW